MSVTDGAGPEAEPAPAAPPAAKGRRRRSESAKRLLFIILGAVVLVGSVAGFYLTSDAFDDRVPVLVSARHIEPGETVSAADLASDLAVVGSIPHVPWTAANSAAFAGMVAVQPIPAGALVRFDMFAAAETMPEGAELEVVVPLDMTLATEEVSEGDLVLLVDPGVEPSGGDPGRSRRVVREFALRGFDGSQMRLFLPPEEWAEWEDLLEDVGGTLMVVPLGFANTEETTRRLDAVWATQWSAAVDEIAAAASAAMAVPAAGPGELEVIVSFDASLVPSGVSEGDLVLMIDPGAEPLGNDAGRPRSVIGTLELENYVGGQMQMFVPPEDWLYWRSLPEQLGGTPLVLPVPEGTDTDDMIERLDDAWYGDWKLRVNESVEIG